MPKHNSGHDNQKQHQHTDHGHRGHERMFRNRFWICMVLSIPVILCSPTIQGWFNYEGIQFPGSAWITPLLSVVIFIIGGLPFLKMAAGELQKRQPGMMTLISLAISVAFVYSLAALLFSLGRSFFWELVTLIDVMLLGHWMEMRSIRQASGALDQLAQLLPDEAERIKADGSTEKVPVNALEQGDLFLVRPGESIAADGKVIEGESAVNEAMLTGESKPVQKTKGEEVIGGTVNGEGSLRVKVTHSGESSTLSKIMHLVDEAQKSKSDTQVMADKAAGWLFYAALGAAALTAVIWILFVGLELEVLKRVVTVLVIACPHALGLAIPLVVAITTSVAAQHGILLRDRLAAEQARQVDTVMFDKTGTLTKGEHKVIELETDEQVTGKEALVWAAAVERDSEHLMAKAIRKAADEKQLDIPQFKNFTALKGRGVSAEYQEDTFYVGGPGLLEKLALDLAAHFADFRSRAGKKGQSVVYLIRNKKPLAAFAIADEIRAQSYRVVKQLQKQQIEVAMLTGDSEPVAAAVARELNIDRYFAEVLPQDKDKTVADIQSQGKRVAMVGDGVNDAPALVRADIGIAIGSGTDVAVESADIILVKNNPADILNILRISRASYRKMVQNLWWAAGYNIIAIPLAAGVLAPLGFLMPVAIGALVMSLSTVIVALNAQLLRRVALTSE